MDAASGGEPPPTLRLKWMCNEYSALPEGNSVMDQDINLMTEMTALDNIYRAVSRIKNLSGDKIHLLTGAERRILKTLVDMGLLFR